MPTCCRGPREWRQRPQSGRETTKLSLLGGPAKGEIQAWSPVHLLSRKPFPQTHGGGTGKATRARFSAQPAAISRKWQMRPVMLHHELGTGVFDRQLKRVQ